MDFKHIKAASEDEFHVRGVELLQQETQDIIRDHGEAIIGLSGGETPAPIYQALGCSKEIDFQKVTIFLVDDRFVLGSFPESNQRLLDDTLLRCARIDDDHLVVPDPRLPIDECVEDYNGHIETLLKEGIPYIVPLGLGSDGHIASLFPPLLDDAFGEAFVINTVTPMTSTGRPLFPVKERISTTMRVLCGAKTKIVLLNGAKKRRVWEEMMKSDEDECRWPMKAILASGGVTVLSVW